MNKQLKKLIEPAILAGIIDADREDLIRVAQLKLEDDSLSYGEKICWAAELHDLVDQRSDVVNQELEQELQDRIN